MRKSKQLLLSVMTIVSFSSVALIHSNVNAQNDYVTSSADQDLVAKVTDAKWASSKKYKQDLPVQILGINDFHGGLTRTYNADLASRNYKGAGTAARLAAYLTLAQKSFEQAHHNGKTFRVESGDMVGASPADSALLRDEPTMHVLRQMQITIGTLGNHEFDDSLGEFQRILVGRKPNMKLKDQYGYNDVLKDYPHLNSKIQITVANVVNRVNGKIPYGFKPYIIKTVKQGNKKVKVGFIGILTKTMPRLTTYKNYHPYRYLDEATTIAKYEKQLRRKGVKAIIVLAHTGVISQNGKTAGESVDILKKLYRIDPHNSVDLYLAGHSHQYANATVGHTKLMQAIYSGAAFDDVIGYLNPKTKDFAKGSLVGHVFPVMSAKDDPSVQPDPKVAAIVADADKRTAPLANIKIGQAMSANNIPSQRGNSQYLEESPAGDIAIDAQLYETNQAAKQKHAKYTVNFGMTNTGGVRADLLVDKDKNITLGAARAVQPWYNDLFVVSMTGKQIYDVLNQQNTAGDTRYLLVAGMTVQYTESSAGTDRYHVTKVIDDATGKELDLNKRYNVVINSFLHDGGDGFTEFKKAKLVDDQVGKDTDFLIQYIKDMSKNNHTLVAPKADRKQKITQ